MLPFLRIAHVIAVALWFGSAVFFTVAGVLIFQAYAAVMARPTEVRDWWQPPTEVVGLRPVEGLPVPMAEAGSRAAGVAVGAVFPFYYGLQTGCGVVALVTAALLARRAGEGGGHRVRVALCGLALLTALGGWWLERRVTQLRVPRNELTDLAMMVPEPDLAEHARAARAEFGQWHGYSLIQNFATLALVLSMTVYVPSLSAATSRGR